MKRLIVIVLALSLLLGLCSGAAAEEQEPIKLGILAPTASHDWVAGAIYYAELYCEELGIDFRITTSDDSDEMAAQLDELLLWGANAIVVFPQWEGMEAPIQQAINDGVTVVNFDFTIDAEGLYHVNGDDSGMGVQGAHYIAEKLDGKGKVVILDVPTAGLSTQQRRVSFEETIGEIAPDIEIIGTYATMFTREDGYNDMAEALALNPEIDAVFSIDDETSLGALKAIDEAGRTDIKVITGGGGCQEYFNIMPKYEDLWVQSALYSPIMIKDAIDAAIAVYNGAEVETDIIIPTSIVDRENYTDYLDENSPY